MGGVLGERLAVTPQLDHLVTSVSVRLRLRRGKGEVVRGSSEK